MRVRRAVVDAIVAHAQAARPQECCGLLLGDEGTIDEGRAAANLRGSAVAYLVDPADHFAAIRSARESGRRVVGAYHSHPASAPVPSRSDIAESHDPALLHVIVSLAGDEPSLRAYRIDGGNFVEVPLVPVP